jgi:Putative transmembrane protein (PGPGW)
MDWIESHQAWFWWLAAASLAMLVVSPIVVGWIVVRLPADYFANRKRHDLPFWEEHSGLRVALRIVKNFAGVALLLAGVVMLVVPGQGLLTIVVGILLLDFPGKFRVQQWLVMRKAVWRSINWLRKRAGREPFEGP